MPWIVKMNYIDGKAVYPDNFPKSFRKYVIHRPNEKEVFCELLGGFDITENIQGAEWKDIVSGDTLVSKKKAEKIAVVESIHRAGVKPHLEYINNFLNDTELFEKLVKEVKILLPEEIEEDTDFLGLLLSVKRKLDKLGLV